MYIIRKRHAHAIALVAIAGLPSVAIRIDKQKIESSTKSHHYAYGKEVTHPGLVLRLLLPFPPNRFLGVFRLFHLERETS
jgi:hypothetical protein